MLCDSQQSLIQINNDDTTSNSRMFKYNMNKKRAKAKLLKGAKRTSNLSVEVKSGCVNLRFDDGSYFEVILPMVRE